MNFLNIEGLKRFLAQLLTKVVAAINEVADKVTSIEGDYLSKSNGGTVGAGTTFNKGITVNNDIHSEDVYIGKWTADASGHSVPVEDIDPSTNKNRAAGSLRVNGTTELAGDIITHGQSVEFNNLNLNEKLNVTGSAFLPETFMDGTLNMENYDINNVQSITVSGTVRGNTYKAPKLDANAASGTRIGKSTEPYADIYGTNIHGSLKGHADSARKVNNALSISLNGGAAKKYDGSAAQTIDINASAVGAAASGHNHDDKYLKTTANAASATKLQSAKSIALGQDVVGSANFDGSSNITINATRRGTRVGQSGASATNPWYRVASYSTSKMFEDANITFYIHAGYGDNNKINGILHAHIRTSGTAGVHESQNLTWIVADEGIVPEDYVLAYKDNSGGAYTVELWTRIAIGYQCRFFDVISEGDRITRKNVWTLYDAYGTGQAASPTAGYTQVTSTYLTINNKAAAAGTADKANAVDWANVNGKPTIPSYSAATQSAAGLMSAADKKKVDNMAEFVDLTETQITSLLG